MVPYIDLPKLDLFGLTFYPFGVLIAVALLVGYLVMGHRAKEVSFSAKNVDHIFVFTIIPAYIGSHIFEVLFYRPGKVLQDPLLLLRITDGISSFGGMLTFLIAFTLYLRVTGNTSKWRLWADIITQAFIIGWIFGRLGCTVAHDHPGLASNFFLAVDYPGGARHDLGFYEFLYTILLLVPASLWIRKRNWLPGSQMAVFLILYGPFRFLADFLRTADVRYLGLTPGQYAGIAFFALGFVVLRWVRKPQKQAVV
ncbi:prolipoprotein diacylglyceryl transferase [Oligoflexia bacterium]|nr:prolipoprotein diacylglyceryl transferase [Oligoflexia bacterium]